MATSDSHNVREDPDLDPEEKEVIIRFAKDEDEAHVFAEDGGIMRRLLSHPEADVSPQRTVEGNVVSVSGSVPIGCLKIGSTPRKNGGHANVVTSSAMGTSGERSE